MKVNIVFKSDGDILTAYVNKKYSDYVRINECNIFKVEECNTISNNNDLYMNENMKSVLNLSNNMVYAEFFSYLPSNKFFVFIINHTEPNLTFELDYKDVSAHIFNTYKNCPFGINYTLTIKYDNELFYIHTPVNTCEGLLAANPKLIAGPGITFYNNINKPMYDNNIYLKKLNLND